MGRLIRALDLWDVFQITVWAVFLVLSPPVCLLRGLYFGAAVCSVLGLFLANMLFTRGTRFAAMRGRKVLRWGMNIELGLVGVASLVMLFAPPTGGWSVVPGTDGWFNVSLALDQGELMALRAHSRSYQLGRLRADRWQFSPIPGGISWDLAVAPDHTLWATPEGLDEALALDPGASQWRRVERPDDGFVRHLDATNGVVLVTSQRPYLLGHDGRWQPLGPKHSSDACRAGRRWLTVGSPGVSESDDGLTWRQVFFWDARFPLLACAPDGQAYAIDGGLLWGQMRARGTDGVWRERSLPAPDVRVALVNPARSGELWLGTWGQGVFRSTDGGVTFQDLGLRGFEIRAMAVDFQAGRAFVAPSNLAYRSGVWSLSFSP